MIRQLFVLCGLLLAGAGLAFAAQPTRSAAQPGAVTEFTIPTANSYPGGITLGPDGNLWFTEQDGNKIGRLTPAGAFTEFPTHTTPSQPWDIVTGPDGNLWFTEYYANQIGRITPAGSIREYPIPTAYSAVQGIAAGLDGRLWFAESEGNNIGRITITGTVHEFPLPTPVSYPIGIAPGSDGNLWFAEDGLNKIGRITTGGTITQYTVPTASSGPVRITRGAGNTLWFTEFDADRIGKITTAGAVSDFPILTAGGAPYGIALGPDGNLWFTEDSSNKIGRITPAGVVTEYSVPTSASHPHGITAGPDGAMWFTEEQASKIGRITVPGAGTPTPTPPPSPTPICGLSFADVHPTDYFYTPVMYLACHGVVSGYGDGTFRPYGQTTRGQMVKIVVLGFNKPIATPTGGNHTFADVSTSFPFFSVIETAAADGIVSGYGCGGPGEPCDSQHRPYFRPYANVTRGQLAKIVVGAAGWALQNPASGTFADVAPGSAFYPFVETAACHQIISGYACGGAGEPCDPQQRPYFRQASPSTRGQIAKIVYGALTGGGSCP